MQVQAVRRGCQGRHYIRGLEIPLKSLQTIQLSLQGLHILHLLRLFRLPSKTSFFFARWHASCHFGYTRLLHCRMNIELLAGCWLVGWFAGCAFTNLELFGTEHRYHVQLTKMQFCNQGAPSCLQVLERVLSHLRQNLTFLHKLVDNIALLDVLCAFRVAVTESHGEFVRPTCVPHGPIAIVGGHHPLVENSLEGRAYQPNDTYLAGAYWCI